MNNRFRSRQDIYHRSDNDGPNVSVKVEKNSKGYNWEASVSGAKSVDEAIELLRDAEEKMRTEFGSGNGAVSAA